MVGSLSLRDAKIIIYVSSVFWVEWVVKSNRAKVEERERDKMKWSDTTTLTQPKCMKTVGKNKKDGPSSSFLLFPCQEFYFWDKVSQKNIRDREVSIEWRKKEKKDNLASLLVCCCNTRNVATLHLLFSGDLTFKSWSLEMHDMKKMKMMLISQ